MEVCVATGHHVIDKKSFVLKDWTVIWSGLIVRGVKSGNPTSAAASSKTASSAMIIIIIIIIIMIIIIMIIM